MRSFNTFFGYDAADTEELRLEKFAAFLVAGSCTLAGIIWAGMYYYILGWGLTTMLPVFFILIVGSAMLVSHRSKNHHYAIYAQIICIIYITAFIQWSIGGVFNSGFVLVWAFVGPICALMFFSIRQSLFWFALYLINLVITVILNDYFSAHGLEVSEGVRLTFFLMNLGGSSIVVFLFANYYVNSAVRERKKAQKLIESSLQREIVLRQSEKLATLGRLSAGIAHELNNPASAAQRGADQLRESLSNIELARFNLGQANLSESKLLSLKTELKRVEQMAKEPINLDPIARSDNELDIENWLEAQTIDDAGVIAPILVNLGYDCNELTRLSKQFKSSEFSIIVALLSSTYETRSVLEEIGQGTSRITEIIQALKAYTYLNQAPMQIIDVHTGLDNSLIILRSKLKAGIRVRREYDDTLPTINAYGSELNQVWTNILDNAIHEMAGQGEIVLRTFQDEDLIVVEIEDSGPGIPEHILHKVFDPFFTTKAPGEGTGLGLNISHNIIVQKHSGSIKVTSSPGKTCFQVRLPIAPTS